MRIISFITEFSVIRQILNHFVLWVAALRDSPKQESMPELVCEPFDDGWPAYKELSSVMH
jgi:hypothetical protein